MCMKKENTCEVDERERGVKEMKKKGNERK